MPLSYISLQNETEKMRTCDVMVLGVKGEGEFKFHFITKTLLLTISRVQKASFKRQTGVIRVFSQKDFPKARSCF